MTAILSAPPIARRSHTFGPFRIDPAERTLTRGGCEVALTPKSFDLLLTLIERAGHLQSRDALIDALWPDSIVEDHTLTWNLSALRRALGDTADPPKYIETVRGYGYRFIAPVGEEGAPDAWHREPESVGLAVSDALAEPDAAGSAVQDETRLVDDGGRDRSRRARYALLAAMLVAVAGTFAWQRFASRDVAVAESGRSIAVLPFENLSADPANVYFANGVQETIATQLGGIHDLRVISRFSSETYGSHPADLADVGRALHAANVLEGSVQKSGNEVLINLQLVDTRSGDHLWAETYRRTLADVFDVQSDVAEKVVTALRAKLLSSEASRVTHLPTLDAQAYDLFLKAEYAAERIEAGSANDRRATTAEAREDYEKAIARDPNFALAYARLSFLESHAYWLPVEHTPARAQAGWRAAQQALALDPDLPQAHLAMGYAYYYGRFDYPDALAEFDRALRMMPNNAEAIASVANIQRRRGESALALEGYQRAEVLDPRNPQWPRLMGNELTMLRRYADADAAYERALAVDPHNSTALIDEAFDRMLDGDLAAARVLLARLPASENPDGYATIARYVLAWLERDPDAALALLANASPTIEAPWTPSTMPADLLRAQAFELKGDRDAARRAYGSAKTTLLATLGAQPKDAATTSLLGLAEAGLGEADAAIEAGRAAIALRPTDQDAVMGWSYVTTLAEIEIRVGRTQDAVDTLKKALHGAAGRVVSIPLIERDPRFDSVRAQVLAAR